jgi:hypothetical protein
MALADRMGLVGIILGLFAIAAPYLWPDKKWIGWLSLSLAVILIAMWGWLEFKPQLLVFYQTFPIRSTLLVFVCGGLLASGLWLWVIRGNKEATPSNPGLAAQVEKPPTLLDLFKKDFPNMMKASDNEDAYTMQSPDGSTLKITRQAYMDFDAKSKFVGFYIPMPTPPSADWSGQKTLVACMELLRIDAPKQTFDHFEKQVAVLGGYGDQMTSLKDLTFSGRVLIYYEEFLPIPQKAEILKAYEAKRFAVTFRGTDYLGNQVIAWHQQHDKQAAKQP